MLNKSEIMKNSWKAFKKGDFETFAEALKAMWQLFKKSIKLFADEIQSVEKLSKRMITDREFCHRANGSNLSKNRIYPGEGKTSWINRKIWTAKGRSRMYATEMIDGKEYNQKYIEVKGVE